MFTGKPLGLLTLNVQYPTQYGFAFIYSSEVSIPLLEGGLLYRGAFSELIADWVDDLLLFTDNQVIHSVQFNKISPTEYQVRVNPQVIPPSESRLVIQTTPDDPQLFFGTVTQLESGQVIKFLYKDIREPITIGVITIVVVGTAALLCALNDIVGLYGNRECKKIRADFGFHWEGGIQMGCKVECIDPSSQ